MSLVVDGAAPGGLLADDVWVALRPSATYARLVAAVGRVSRARALERPALVLLVLGTVFPIVSVGRVTAGLVVATMAAWTFALAVQLIAAVALIFSVPARRLPMAASLHLFFAGHLPWSFWLLAVAALTLSEFPVVSRNAALHSFPIAVGWTAVVVAAFCRTVLGTSRRGAWLRSVLHQVCIWGVVLTFAAWAAGGWFRIFG